MGLVHQPRVVMMDEPTVGIDPQARANILDVVREHRRRGHHGALHHALPGRGRGALRSHRHHGPRQDPRRGHPRRAEAHARRGRDRHGSAARSTRTAARDDWVRWTRVQVISAETDRLVLSADGRQRARWSCCPGFSTASSTWTASRSSRPASTACSSSSPAGSCATDATHRFDGAQGPAAQVRSPMGLLFCSAFPVIFATLIALTFGTGAARRVRGPTCWWRTSTRASSRRASSRPPGTSRWPSTSTSSRSATEGLRADRERRSLGPVAHPRELPAGPARRRARRVRADPQSRRRASCPRSPSRR